MAVDNKWQGKMIWCSSNGSYKNICSVVVKSNFSLPNPMKLVVDEVARPPLPELAYAGLSFTVENNQENASEYMKFIQYLGPRVSEKGVVIPDTRKFARVILGSGPQKRAFYMKCPEGNPNFLQPHTRLQCYQAKEDLRPSYIEKAKVVTADQQPAHNLVPTIPTYTPPPPQPQAPTAQLPQPMMYPPPGPAYMSPLHPPPPGYMHAMPHGYPPFGYPPYPIPGYPPAKPEQDGSFEHQLGPMQPKQNDSGGGSSSGTAEQAGKVTVENSSKKDAGLVQTHNGVDKTILATQAHSHPFVFGAIAELVDNCWDQGATSAHVGISEELKQPVFYVRDDGNGMDAAGLSHMFRLGHKREAFDKEKLGKYGVGFKTGSMRIGKNAVVFTRKGDTGSIGLLSQAYNRSLPEDHPLDTPMLTFKMPECVYDESVHTEEQAIAAQDAIAKVSPFSKHRQVVELMKLGDHGTAIFIWDLEKKNNVNSPCEVKYELEWSDNDIQLPQKKPLRRPGNYAKSMPLDWSLRSYFKMLYIGNKKRKFDIILQGKSVPREIDNLGQQLERRSIVYKRKFPIHYEEDVEGMEPGTSETAKLVFGILQKEKEDDNCGVCIYWRHRMITSFDTMSVMTQKDFGIVGLASTASILNPTNNKQDFKKNTDNYEAVEKWIMECFDDYKYKEFGEEVHGKIRTRTAEHDIDCKWAQCDSCGKWRRLPPGVEPPDEEESWYCWNLPKGDPLADCTALEEVQQEEEITTEVNQRGRVVAASNGNTQNEFPQESPNHKKIKTEHQK